MRLVCFVDLLFRALDFVVYFPSTSIVFICCTFKSISFTLGEHRHLQFFTVPKTFVLYSILLLTSVENWKNQKEIYTRDQQSVVFLQAKTQPDPFIFVKLISQNRVVSNYKQESIDVLDEATKQR